ncbi:hypothetical protein BN1195_03605 [Chryseobacterium oranimense G311]|uniref:hypothetical protein n=1 Tax=Chryseobacterium oranimense TaxID=421058 RepID=UPI000533A109|nr:hypothetical protein [Chryseobacterium oranimense]CEJ71260.1 hypothetical protein BN1195_03605 [Chryseobacterium oranimense G311]
MKYEIGKYVVVPEKPFPSMDEAVRYIQKKFPELEKETIEKFISPSIKKEDGNDKPGDISEENSDSEKASAEDGATSIKGVQIRKDKSGQPFKRENK